MTTAEPTNSAFEWTAKLTDNPFEWISRLDWNDLADNCDANEYTILDDIYRILTDGFDPNTIYHDAVLAMSFDEMRDYYTKHFPRVVGQALELIGRDLQNGTLPIIVEYPDT